MKNHSMKILTIILLFTAVTAHATRTERVGYAYAPGSDALLYTETHNEVRQGDGIISDYVTYHDAEGILFATKKVDYSKNRLVPDFHLRNQRTGHIETGTSIGSEYRVEFSRNNNTAKQDEILPLPDNGVADAGFDQLIIRHWEEITTGKKLVRKFLIPSLFGFYDFRIYQSEIVEKDHEKKRIILVEPDNFFYRLLGGTTRLEYAFDQPRLKVFTGISNMRDAGGENLQVKIVFPSDDIRMVSSE